MTDGIHIPREVAEAEGVPEDLDANVVGPYRFPDPHRRRLASWIYVAGAAVLAGLALSRPAAWVGVGIVALVVLWHAGAAWRLGIDQEEALERAARAVPFAVGHASAAVTFHGLRARPVWHVVLYSAEDPPRRRALCRLDAVDGSRTDDVYVEDVPDR